MSAVPADAPARQRILDDLGSTLFVEAGAGSGKTTSLVGRFVSLVLAGVDVAGIAAITFTEAAASELRARIREALEDVVALRPLRSIEVGPDGPDRARTALERLDRATVATLHAFAQRLLLGAPIEAGLPPRVEVNDEIASALRSEERWGRFVTQLLDDDELEVALLAGLALDISIDKLEAVAATFDQNWDLLEHLDLDAERERVVDEKAISVSVDPLFSAADQIVELAGSCTDDADLLLCWIRDEMQRALVPLRAAAQDPYTLLQVATTPPKIRRVGKKPNWPGGGKDAVLALWDDAVDQIGTELAEVTDLVLRRLSAEVVDHTLAEARTRRRDGRLEFHDLLVLARQVLRDDVHVRRRMHDRYQHLLIDEFQDTDPIQVELAVRIAADPEHDTSTPWDEVDVAPGRLFFVGDPKQSIHRFRRADIDLFVRTAERHPAGATRLDTNFRTVAPVVEFCNELFGELIRKTRAPSLGDDGDDAEAGEVGEVAQPEYAHLRPWRPAIADDPGPAVVLLGGPEKESTDDSLRTAEAADIAGTLARARAEGWQVQPDGEAQARRCGWGDMAVLLPSRTSLPHLRRALGAADVPYRLETGSLVYATTEVRDLLSVLRAIDDPGDEVALLGALRSPAYGCGDDDLLRWRRAGRAWSYLAVPDDATGPVAEAFGDLATRHRARPFRTVPELVDAVVRERRLMEISLAADRHRDAWRLYRVVTEHARQFADADPGGLREFLRWVGLQADDKLRVTVPVLPEADVDAVRILTIHGAKGLEFGITAVSGLSGQFPNPLRGAVVRFRPEGGFDVRMKQGLETAQFDERRTVEDVMDEHEGIRLLYVALTRARDHLVVSLHHKPGPSIRCHAHRISSVLDAGVVLDPVAVERVEGASAHRAEHGADAPRAIATVAPVGERVTDDAAQEWAEVGARWRAERAQLLDASRGGGAMSATAVSRHLAAATGAAAGAGAGDSEVVDRPEPSSEPWRRGRAGTSVGSAVHAVLQHADLSDPTGADVPALARWQANVEGIPDAAAEIEAKARAALTSHLVRRAVSSQRWWREVHVGVPLERLLDHAPRSGIDVFEGFIDLLFEDDHGLVVVDYKTDSVSDQASIDVALDRYASQGAAYAVALEAAIGRPVTEVHFLFLRAGDVVDRTVDGLRDRMAAVEAALVEIDTAG
ncbi:MAG: UvrD-helicase domain-containing protein [Acidimicrobiales bacterium]